MTEYHYTECGLDNVYLSNGFKISKTKEGENVFIHDIHGLHKAIGMCLLMKPSILNGQEIRFIRHTLDWSQKTLGNTLGVSYQSVLGWEKDKTPIQETTDRLLRALFYSYLNPTENKAVFDKVKQLADLDAKSMQKKSKKVVFAEKSRQWRKVA